MVAINLYNKKWISVNVDKKFSKLNIKMKICKYTLTKLLLDISVLEKDNFLPINEKNSKIKIIKDELKKVGEEIDNIKKEITLMNNYKLN